MLSFSRSTLKMVNARSQNAVLKTSLQGYEGDTLLCNGISIKIPLDGIEYFTLNGHTHEVNKGAFLLTKNQDRLRGFLPSARECTNAYCIYLDEQLYQEAYLALSGKIDFYQDCSSSIPEIQSGLFYFEPSSSFSNYLQSAIKIGVIEHFTDFHYLEIIEQLVCQQLEHRDRLSRLSVQKISTKQELIRRAVTAYNYLLDHNHRSVSLDELSKVAFMSKYHLLRVFKEVYQKTPHQIQIERRIKEAQQQILSGKGIKQVALSLGFSDTRTFRRTFRHLVGCSPSDFKKKENRISNFRPL